MVDLWAKILKDMEARRELGLHRYGRPVTICNGRDAGKDLYEELLDALVYQKQQCEEKQALYQELQALLDLHNVANIHVVLEEILNDYFSPSS